DPAGWARDERLVLRRRPLLRTDDIAGGGKPHDELAPLSGARAPGLDRPAVKFDQPAHQRQTNPDAALRAVQRTLALDEQVEDAGQHDRVDADAGVLDAEHDLAALPLDRQPDAPTGVGVLCR